MSSGSPRRPLASAASSTRRPACSSTRCVPPPPRAEHSTRTRTRVAPVGPQGSAASGPSSRRSSAGSTPAGSTSQTTAGSGPADGRSRRSSVPASAARCSRSSRCAPGHRASTSVPPSGRARAVSRAPAGRPPPSAACHRAPLGPSSTGTSTLAHPNGRAGAGSGRTGWPGSVSRSSLPSGPSSATAATPAAGWNPTASVRVKGNVRPPPSAVPRAPSHWTICTGKRVGEEPVAGPGGLPGPVTASRRGEWRWTGSNRRPSHCERDALPTELHPRRQGPGALYAPRGACQRTPGFRGSVVSFRFRHIR